MIVAGNALFFRKHTNVLNIPSHLYCSFQRSELKPVVMVYVLEWGFLKYVLKYIIRTIDKLINSYIFVHFQKKCMRIHITTLNK